MPPRKPLPTALERDLDRVRIRGVERLTNVDPAAWEALPEITLFTALLETFGSDRPGVRRALLYSLTVREVCRRAIDHLGASTGALATAELFGLGSGPSDGALAAYAAKSGEISDLARREIAAAETFGEVSVAHFRQEVARKQLIPELARAIVELDGDAIDDRSLTRSRSRPPRRSSDVEANGIANVRSGLREIYAGLPKLESLAATIAPGRPSFTDVTVRYSLSDSATSGDEYTLRATHSFSAELTEYTIALTTSAVTADVIVSECPLVSDFHTCSDEQALEALCASIEGGTGISVIKVGENDRGRTVQTQLPLVRIPSDEEAGYTADLPEDLQPEVLLYRAAIADLPEPVELVCTVNTSMQKSDHYCYWVADRPMFMRGIEFDTAGLTTTGRGLTLQPFLGSLGSSVVNTHGTFRLSIDSWIVAGQGAVLVW